jgi:hypothetical protein
VAAMVEMAEREGNEEFEDGVSGIVQGKDQEIQGSHTWSVNIFLFMDFRNLFLIIRMDYSHKYSIGCCEMCVLQVFCKTDDILATFEISYELILSKHLDFKLLNRCLI